jgi:hypothetical protein
MAKKTLTEKIDALTAAHLSAKDRVSALEAEAEGIDEQIERLSWNMEDYEASAEAAVQLDARRRLALPRALRQAKLDELAAREKLIEAREEELKARIEPSYERLQEAERALAQAKENHRAALGSHNDLVYNRQGDLRGERRQLLRERNAFESEPAQPARGLPVYTVWHLNNKPHPDDPGLSGDSPSTAWGVANVNDRPLSEGSGEGDKTVGVVPTRALKQHAAKKKK